jgi:hypothetical protein
MSQLADVILDVRCTVYDMQVGGGQMTVDRVES